MEKIIDIAYPVSTFYEAIFENYQQVSSKNTVHVHFINMAGFTIQLNIISTAFREVIIPPFQHLSTISSTNPDLIIYLWDSVVAGASFIDFPWQPEDVRGQGVIRGYNTVNYCTAYAHGAKGINALDLKNNRGFFWVQDALKLPSYEKGAPLRNILHWWFRTKDILLTHAAAVGTEKGGVLLVGKGGSGKSTTSVACLGSNLKYLSDDYCLTTVKNNGYAYTAYNTAKVARSTLAKFKDLQAIFKTVTPLKAEKNIYFLKEQYEDGMISQFPIKAIFVPIVTPNLTASLVKISAITAIKALAPSSIFQLPGTGKKEFLQFAELAKKVPCYQLNLGTNLKEIPEIIDNFLKNANDKGN